LRELDEERGSRIGLCVPEFSVGRKLQRDRGHKQKGRDAMRELKNAEAYGRGETPLVVRGSFQRVFLSLGVFMEAGLLFCGSYLLADAILQPLDAGMFSVVGGGLFLGLATVLLFYLAWPSKRRSISRRDKAAQRSSNIPLNSYEEKTQRQSSWVTEKKEGMLRPM
jgi:hypothetical protein